MAAGVAEEVAGEQVLGVAARTGAHGEHHQRRAPGDLARDLRRDHLDLSGERARLLEGPHPAPHLEGGVQGLADSAEAAGPGASRGDEADVADHRDALGSEPRDHLDACRAVAGVGAESNGVVPGSEIVVGGGEHAVGESDLHEAVTRGLSHRGVPEVAFDREHVDPGLGAGGGLVGVLDVDHGQLADTLQGPEISDGAAGAVHGSRLRRGLRAGDTGLVANPERLAQLALQDLAGRGLREQVRGDVDPAGHLEPGDQLTTVLRQVVDRR